MQTGREVSMPNEARDPRMTIYQDLHHNQLRRQEDANRHSAALILTELFRRYAPRSVLDVGCGLGTWLEVAQSLGVSDILGIEGDWLDRSLVRIPEQQILNLDLERSFDLGRCFDLLICLEVAEHLRAEAAARFVESLVRHADVILFSAAIPYQGGHHHVNEQFPEYWAQLFGRFGYRAVDCIRPVIWSDTSILWYLRQNSLVFAKQELTTGSSPFAGLSQRSTPIAVVHPELYLLKLKYARCVRAEHEKLLAVLRSGNTFSVVRESDGRLTITRTS